MVIFFFKKKKKNFPRLKAPRELQMAVKYTDHIYRLPLFRYQAVRSNLSGS